MFARQQFGALRGLEGTQAGTANRQRKKRDGDKEPGTGEEENKKSHRFFPVSVKAAR